MEIYSMQEYSVQRGLQNIVSDIDINYVGSLFNSDGTPSYREIHNMMTRLKKK